MTIGGPSPFRLAIAYQSIRLLEEVGMPRAFAGWGWDSSLRKPAATVLGEAEANEALGVVLRSRDKDLLDLVASRARIAGLSSKQQSYFFGVARRAVLAASKRLPVTTPPDNWPVEVRTSSEFRFAADFVSRLAVVQHDRDQEAFLLEVIEMLVQTRRNDPWRVGDAVDLMARRTVQSLPAEAIVRHLAMLLSVPPREGTYDPVDELVLPVSAVPGEVISASGPFIDEAIDQSSSEFENNRRAACRRLAHLNHFGLLTEVQQCSWRDALYSQIDAFGFPSKTGCLDALILALPTDGKHDELAMFRDKYLERSKVTSPLIEGDVREFMRIMGGNRDNLQQYRSLAWTFRDRDVLVSRIVSTLQRNAERVATNRRIPEGDHLWSSILRGNESSEISRLAQFLSELIEVQVLSARRANQRHLGRIRAAFLSAAESGLPVLSVFPTLCRWYPELKIPLEDKVIGGLVSVTDQEFFESCNVVMHWADLLGQSGIPDIPTSILGAVISLTTTGYHSRIVKALRVAARLIAKLPADFVKPIADGTLTLLDDWKPVLVYGQRRDLYGKSTLEIGLDVIPELRRAMVRLALSLQQRGHEHPAVVYWLEQARNDPLPEVRKEVSGQLSADSE